MVKLEERTEMISYSGHGIRYCRDIDEDFYIST